MINFKRIAKKIASTASALGYLRIIIDKAGLVAGQEQHVPRHEFFGTLIGFDVREAINLLGSNTDQLLELYPSLEFFFESINFKKLHEVLKTSMVSEQDSILTKPSHDFMFYYLNHEGEDTRVLVEILNLCVFKKFSPEMINDLGDHGEDYATSQFEHIFGFTPTSQINNVESSTFVNQPNEIIVQYVFRKNISPTLTFEATLDYSNNYSFVYEYAEMAGLELEFNEVDEDLILNEFLPNLFCKHLNPSCKRECHQYRSNRSVFKPSRQVLTVLKNIKSELFRGLEPEEIASINEESCAEYMRIVLEDLDTLPPSSQDLRVLWEAYLGTDAGRVMVETQQGDYSTECLAVYVESARESLSAPIIDVEEV